jgi:hypothetical protein
MRGRGSALADALMWPGGVVVLLVFGQDGRQVCLVQDQGAVQELTAQGSESATIQGRGKIRDGMTISPVRAGQAT